MTIAFDLDHVGLLVPDLEAARRAFERMGFRLTAKSSHEGRLRPDGPVEAWGTGNHCAVFRQGYLELLGITDPDRYHEHVKSRLARYQGLHLIALGCQDAEAVRADWAKAAGSLRPVAEIGRAVPQAGGGTRPAGFRIVYLDDYVPEIQLFAIQHLDPEVIWQPTLVDQPNGVVALRGATVVSSDPQATVDRLAAIGLAGAAGEGGWRRVPLAGRGWIDIVSPAEAERRFPGETPPALPAAIAATYEVADLAATRRYLETADVPARLTGGRVRVSGRHAQGCTVDFVAAGAEEDRR